jgi:putative DNA primase/helicase
MSTALAENVDQHPALNRVLGALRNLGRSVQPRGNQWIAGCPCHDDQHPSLSIALGDNGRAVLCCHAGCRTEDVAAALGLTLADLFEQAAPRRAKRQLVRTYDYPDECHQLLYQACRFEPKAFSMRRPNGPGRWKPNLAGVRRVLYRLPELLAADRDRPVFVVEGEKDVERLRELGLVATTNPLGAGSWRPEFSEFLRDRRVVLLPDNDAPGQAHALQVAGAVHGVAAEVKIVDLPSLPPKSDVSDWLALPGAPATANEARARLLELGERAAPWHPDSPATTMTTPVGLAGVVESALGALECPPTRDAVVAALRGLAEAVRDRDALDRAGIRGEAVARLKTLGFPAEEARTLVVAALRDSRADHSGDAQGGSLDLADPEPWPDPVDGSALADEIAATFRRHLALPKGAEVGLTLWTFYAHTHQAFDISPILALTSAERQCGKTDTLLLVGALSPRQLPVSSLTPATLFRTAHKHAPTLLIDEAETILPFMEVLRGIMNAGHLRATAQVPRTSGDDYEVRLYSTWCPKAVALIGRLHPTLEDRSIVIRMRRRAPSESVTRLRPDRLSVYDPLRRQAWTWGQGRLEQLRDADPPVPHELRDRAQDNWRPLLAIADALGSHWPADARDAALVLTRAVPESDSLGEMLLADLRTIFAEKATDRLASEEILKALLELGDRPWREADHGRPLTLLRLARLLKPYGVEPHVTRIGDRTPRGYLLDDLQDPFTRYLDPLDPQHPQHPQRPGEDTDTVTHVQVQRGKAATGLESASGPPTSRLVAGVAGVAGPAFPDVRVPTLGAVVQGDDISASVRAMETDFDLLRDRYRARGLSSATADAMALAAVKALAAATARAPGRNGKVEVGPGGGA